MLTTPTAEAAEPPQPTEVSATTTIENAAKRYGLDATKFLNVAKCEDPGLVPDQQSNYVKNGVREKSYGIFQINIPSNPDVSIASATDPVFAANWAASEWKAGNVREWTCYRNLYE